MYSGDPKDILWESRLQFLCTVYILVYSVEARIHYRFGLAYSRESSMLCEFMCTFGIPMSRENFHMFRDFDCVDSINCLLCHFKDHFPQICKLVFIVDNKIQISILELEDNIFNCLRQ